MKHSVEYSNYMVQFSVSDRETKRVNTCGFLADSYEEIFVYLREYLDHEERYNSYVEIYRCAYNDEQCKCVYTLYERGYYWQLEGFYYE